MTLEQNIEEGLDTLMTEQKLNAVSISLAEARDGTKKYVTQFTTFEQTYSPYQINSEELYQGIGDTVLISIQNAAAEMKKRRDAKTE